MLAIWDVNGSICQSARFQGHKGSVDSCAWSSDGTMIASGDSGGEVRLWDAHAHRLLYEIANPSPSQNVWFLRFSPNGRYLIFGGWYDDYYLWDIVSGQLHKVLRNARPFRTPAFNPDSTRLAIASHDCKVGIWSVETGDLLFVLQEHTMAVSDVAFSPDGKLVLSASYDRTVKVWDTYKGALILSLEGHCESVNAARFSPCGKYVASASADETVQLWRTSDGSCVTVCTEYEDVVDCVVFSPDGSTLSSGANDGTVIVRRWRDFLPPE